MPTNLMLQNHLDDPRACKRCLQIHKLKQALWLIANRPEVKISVSS